MPNNNPAKLANLRMPDYSGSWWQHHPENLTTLPVGKWTPVGWFDIPGNSLVKMKPSLRYEALPMLSPLYGGWTQRTKFYFVPYRLYIPELRKNLHQPWDSFSEVELPSMFYEFNYGTSYEYELDEDEGEVLLNAGKFDIYTIASFSGSLLDRLNMANGEFNSFNSFMNNTFFGQKYGNGGVTYNNSFRSPLLPLLGYIDSWLYGEYNPQDPNIPMDRDTLNIQRDGSVGRVTETAWLDYDILKDIVPSFGFGLDYPAAAGTDHPVTSAFSKDGNYLLFYNYSNTPDSRIRRYYTVDLVPNYPLFSEVFSFSGLSLRKLFAEHWESIRNRTSTVGLLPVTYKGDYFTSWFSEEGINVAQSFVIRSGESLLSLRKRNQDMLIALMSMVSGNRWVDYLQYVFDSELEIKDHPIMIGYDEIDFGGVDIVSNAETSSGAQPVGATSVLGATVSKIRDYNSSVKPFSVKTKEPGAILVCSAIIPNVFYYQGQPRFNFYHTVSDLWHPQYQKQGFQTVFRGEAVNPWVMSEVYYGGNLELNEGFYVDDSPEYLNLLSLGYVPLGWEHMKKTKVLSGGMKTSAFKTWSLHRDMTSLYGYDVEGTENHFGVFNPFTDSGLDYMKSTYVDSGSFNYMFQNISRQDQTNFIVKFSFDMSVYQPVVHTLVDKQGL